MVPHLSCSGTRRCLRKSKVSHSAAKEACHSPPQGRRTCLIACDASDPKSRTRRSGSLPFLFTWRTAQAGRDALCRVPGILRPSVLGCPVHSHPFEKIPPSTPPQASPAFTQPRIFLERVLFAKTPLKLLWAAALAWQSGLVPVEQGTLRFAPKRLTR